MPDQVNFGGVIWCWVADNDCMHCSYHKLSGLLLISLMVIGVARVGFAQNGRSFDAERYFEGLDRNGDERLDKSELNSKALAYLRKIGVDVNDDRIRLRTIKKRLEQNQESSQEQLAQQEKEKLTRGLKVPAFGSPAEEYGVDQFGNGADEGQSIAFSESTLKMVDSVLRRYDKNQDNIIDQKERKAGRWGRPDPNESDLNKDGLLTRDELMRRYHVRELEQEKRNDDSSRNQRGDNSDRDGRRRDDDRRNRSDRDEVSRDRVSGQTAATTTATRSGSRSSQQDREAYEKYSKSLIGRYDKDNDNRLSKEEWKSVRRPPANADENKDGFVSQREYANALMKAAGSKSGSAAAPEASSDGGRDSGSSGSKGRGSSGGKGKGSSGSKGRGSAGGDMKKLDANSDAQVQMHEYSSDWDDGKLEEFYAIDKNRDGVITPAEWKSR